MSPGEMTRFARNQVSIRAVATALKPRITALQRFNLNPNGKTNQEPEVDTSSGDGWQMTCINPNHDDDSPSLSVSVKRNKWLCWGNCGILDLVGAADSKALSASTIDLVLAVVACEAIAVRKDPLVAERYGITATRMSFHEARQFVLDVGKGTDAQRQPGSAPARRRVTTDVADTLARIGDALVTRHRQLVADPDQAPKVREALWSWQVSRNQFPRDLVGRVVWFGGRDGYRYLEGPAGFTRQELDAAGFYTDRGKALYAGSTFLFVFRDPADRPVWFQGFRVAPKDELADRLAQHRRTAQAAVEPDPFVITDTMTVEVFTARNQEAMAARVAKREEKKRTGGPPPKYLSLALEYPGWPFGSEIAARGSRGGNGVLALCEGVPDALVAEGLAEAALGFPGVKAFKMDAERWRTLLCDDDGRPRWRRVMVASDTDAAGQGVVAVVLKELAAAGIPVVTVDDLAAEVERGVIPDPALALDRIVVSRWTTRGKDLSDALGMI